MNWDAVGAIGEVAGALGVIATLGYLAAQIRQNTASIRGATLQNMSEASASFLDLMAADSQLGRIYFAGLEDLESLSPEERARFHFAFFSFLRRTENFHQQSIQNGIRADQWVGLRTSVVSIMERPGSRAWWKANSSRFNPGFVEWMNHEIKTRAG